MFSTQVLCFLVAKCLVLPEFVADFHACWCSACVFSPLAVWPAFCPFSTMHCGVALLSPTVKTEYAFPAAIMSALSRPVTYPNYLSLPLSESTLLKADSNVVEVFVWSYRGDRRCTKPSMGKDGR